MPCSHRKETRPLDTTPAAPPRRSMRNMPFLVLICAVSVAALALPAPPDSVLAGVWDAEQRDAKQVEAEALTAKARAALERMPPESRLEAIEDTRLRRATQAGYRSVAELADNREADAAPALYHRFARAFATFEAEAARHGHATCAFNCKADDEAACRKECKTPNRKLLCGCKLITFGCVVAECLF